MNCTTTGAARATHVRITAPELCKTHGWTVGGTYPTIEHDIVTPDSNGQQVYVTSSTFNRAVWLSDSEYELPDTNHTQTGPEGLTRTAMSIRKHRRTTDESLTIADRLKLVIGNVFGVHPDDIAPSKRFDQDYGADSMDILDLTYSLEDEFDLDIKDGEAEGFRTVGNVLDYLTARVGT